MDKYCKSYFNDEYMAFIFLIWGGIQACSYMISAKNMTVILVEEVIFLVCVLYRGRKICEFNRMIKRGKVIYADYDESGSYYTTYELRGLTRYILHMNCIAQNKTYSKRVDIGAADEGYRNSLIEMLSTHSIPIVIDEHGTGYFICLKDMVLEYMCFDGESKEKQTEIVNYIILVSRYVLAFLIIYFWEC